LGELCPQFRTNIDKIKVEFFDPVFSYKGKVSITLPIIVIVPYPKDFGFVGISQFDVVY
jgi:hypothetical protein